MVYEPPPLGDTPCKERGHPFGFDSQGQCAGLTQRPPRWPPRGVQGHPSRIRFTTNGQPRAMGAIKDFSVPEAGCKGRWRFPMKCNRITNPSPHTSEAIHLSATPMSSSISQNSRFLPQEVMEYFCHCPRAVQVPCWQLPERHRQALDIGLAWARGIGGARSGVIDPAICRSSAEQTFRPTSRIPQVPPSSKLVLKHRTGSPRKWFTLSAF